MSVVEIEVQARQFGSLVQLVASTGGIPAPTIAGLGPDRLITGVEWGVLTPVTGLPGDLADIAGTIVTSGQLGIDHVGAGDLASDAAAATTRTGATVWLRWAVQPPATLIGSIVRVEVNGQPEVFGSGIEVARRAVPVEGIGVVRQAAVLLRDGVVTIRFCTSMADVVHGPTANRSEGLELTWTILVSSGFFVDQLRTRLDEALTELPAGTTVEDGLSVSWVDDGGWSAAGTVGIEKEDACPGLFGDVDISVELTARLRPAPSLDTGVIDLFLRLAGNASDWDAFRCWAGSFGIGSLFAGAVLTPLVTLPLGVTTLAVVGEIVRGDVGSEIGGTDLGSDFQRTGGGDSSVEFRGSSPLPVLPGASASTGFAGPDGVVVGGGDFLVLPATHEASFAPAPPALAGGWHGRVNCSERRWATSHELEPVRINDRAKVLGTDLGAVRIKVFKTSRVVPPAGWTLDLPELEVTEQWVSVTGSAEVTGVPAVALLHTSAGLRRYDLGAPGPPPPPPDDLPIRLVGCRSWGRDIWSPRVEIGWLVDPPPFDWTSPLLKQWLLTMSHVPAGATVALHTLGAPSPLVSVVAAADGPGSIEAVTDEGARLELVTDIAEPPEGVRLVQRWLLPISETRFEAPVQSLVRAGELVAALTDDGVATIVRSDAALSVVHEVRGVSGVARDAGSLVLWGASGAQRTEGGSLRTILDDAVLDAGRAPDGRIRLRGRDGVHTHDGRRSDVDRLGAHTNQRRSVPLPGGLVAAAVSDRVVLAIPFGMR